MKNYFLKWHEYLIFLGFFVLIYLYTLAQRLFDYPLSLKFIGIAIFAVVLVTVYFFIIKPEKSYSLSGHLSIILCVLTVILIFVNHLLIKHDLGWRHSVLGFIAIGAPFVCGFFYDFIRIINKRRK